MNKKIKSEIAIGIILFLAIFVGCLSLLGSVNQQASEKQIMIPVKKTQRQTPQSKTNQQPENNTSQTTDNPAVLNAKQKYIADSSSNWKIYINTKYNYQLQYPSNWIVQNMSGNEQLDQTDAANFRMTTDDTPAESGFLIAVLPNPKNLSLTEWIKQNPDSDDLLSSDFNKINSSFAKINSLSWEKIKDDSIGIVPTGNVKYGIAHGGYLYYVAIYSFADEKNVEQILSTLKFTN